MHENFSPESDAGHEFNEVHANAARIECAAGDRIDASHLAGIRGNVGLHGGKVVDELEIALRWTLDG